MQITGYDIVFPQALPAWMEARIPPLFTFFLDTHRTDGNRVSKTDLFPTHTDRMWIGDVLTGTRQLQTWQRQSCDTIYNHTNLLEIYQSQQGVTSTISMQIHSTHAPSSLAITFAQCQKVPTLETLKWHSSIPGHLLGWHRLVYTRKIPGLYTYNPSHPSRKSLNICYLWVTKAMPYNTRYPTRVAPAGNSTVEL